MSSHLKQLEARIKELEKLYAEVLLSGQAYADGDPKGSADLSQKGEEWYRGVRALLVRENFSGLEAFDWCYEAYYPDIHDKTKMARDSSCISYFIHVRLFSPMSTKSSLPYFSQSMAKARALLNACISEVKSRELSLLGELSFVVAADEFETASNLLQSSQEETITRASGVIARVALERHFRTVAQEHGVGIVKNPPTKAHPDFTDITLSLKNASVITEVQRARLDVLYRIGNNCAHPKEAVNRHDVEELIRDGSSFVGLIL
jgi:hypothetical protein